MSNSHSMNGQPNEPLLLRESAVKAVECCQKSWSPSEDLALEIHREVARAIG